MAASGRDGTEEDQADDLDDEADVVVDVALKEWGAVVAALAAGEQTVIFRKGGLRDGGGKGKKGFKLQAATFALFPTVYHPAMEVELHKKTQNGQQEEEDDDDDANSIGTRTRTRTTSDASTRFVDIRTPDMKKGEHVPITVAAEVTGAWVTHDHAVLEALSDHHVWTRDVLASRLNFKPDAAITVLELRARSLPNDDARALPPDLERYGGCKSWVDLPFQITRGEGVPALSDEEFRARGVALRAALAAVDHSELIDVS